MKCLPLLLPGALCLVACHGKSTRALIPDGGIIGPGLPPESFDGDAGVRAGLDFGPFVESEIPPLPISGGTLLLLGDRHTAIAADPDRDRVSVVDLDTRRVLHTVVLNPHDEPGRAIEDGERRVHVVARGRGELVTIDVDRGEIIDRRSVCTAPRGVAYDAATDDLYVACEAGWLITLPAGGGAPTRRLQLRPDLRDVVVEGDRIWVSRFRAAEVLSVAPDGSFRTYPLVSIAFGMEPEVAWRMVASPTGGVAVLHQLARVTPVAVGPDEEGVNVGSYGGGADPCDSPMVRAAISFVGEGVTPPASTLSFAVLAVDLALSEDGQRIYVASAGNASVLPGAPVYSRTDTFDCVPVDRFGPAAGSEATSVIVGPGDDRLVIQVREPPRLVDDLGEIDLSLPEDQPMADLGHALFHRNAGANIACASCHPEGADDGHLWVFTDVGPRRTQSMRIGIAGTEPFHWDGDIPTFADLADEVFTGRMLGPRLSSAQVETFSHWVFSIPPWPSPSDGDADAIARGRELFHDPLIACSTCHSGLAFTNNANVNVGTGGAFQVPSLLGVSHRMPVMHSGCAETLSDRFDPTCGGGDAHGQTSGLSQDQIADLIAYLESI